MREPRTRRRIEAGGRRAETIAAWRLRLAGYRILGTRIRTPFGEIDIAAARGDVLAIVEVKARPTVAAGVAAVTPMQRSRIAAAAQAYVGKREKLSRRRLRFDIVVVSPWRPPRHVRDAWRPG